MKKKPLPETVSVELTLEESGWLCHLLLPQLLAGAPLPRESFLEWPAVFDAIKKRQERLYIKLAAANDTLMGKE